MSENIWTVPAVVLGVVSGDTLDLLLDLGWHITYRTRCRLVNISAPDISTEEGQAAKRWIVQRLGFGGPVEATGGWAVHVTFVSHELDSQNRSIGQVLATTPQGDSFDLGYDLLAAGHAVPLR